MDQPPLLKWVLETIRVVGTGLWDWPVARWMACTQACNSVSSKTAKVSVSPSRTRLKKKRGSRWLMEDKSPSAPSLPFFPASWRETTSRDVGTITAEGCFEVFILLRTPKVLPTPLDLFNVGIETESRPPDSVASSAFDTETSSKKKHNI